jgi:glyoxylase-like metal-dependent hydrolase (beta-lactamase superfamily II)/rhodanese-related sulfurtransferase
MKIEQIYTGCLAQGAYYITSGKEAVVIDPLREIQPYLDRAEKDGVKIRYVLETHFHADFVSGHLDLANASGATIVFGPNANTDFQAHVASDGEVLKFGDATIEVLHTPGHTMESTCYLFSDGEGKPQAIFTGDTLFIGDVGRPDLAQKSDITQDDLAGMLFDSLRTKVMTLPDELLVYPAHGAGSACGKNMSKETFDTLGHQKAVNYALRADMTRTEFIKEVTTGLMPPPAYFPQNVMMNKRGYDSISEVVKRGTQALSPAAFEAAANETGALLLDTRAPQTFAKGFVPNSINIGIDGGFAPWVGALILDVRQEILLVTDPGREEEVVTRLARVGYDYALGFLEGGFDAWKQSGRETDTIVSVSADELAAVCSREPKVNIVDVRKQSEYLSEHVRDAVNAPLDYVNESMLKVKKDEPVYVHCAAGYRSMIFVSILKARGYNNLINVQGGFKSIRESGKFDVTDYVCPSTLL